jgi:hypothetical protein
MRVSEVIWNGDIDPDVACVDGVERHFDLIPDPPELLDEDEFAERMIQLVNVAREDWNGDRLDGYENTDLFRLMDHQKLRKLNPDVFYYVNICGIFLILTWYLCADRLLRVRPHTWYLCIMPLIIMRVILHTKT